MEGLPTELVSEILDHLFALPSNLIKVSRKGLHSRSEYHPYPTWCPTSNALLVCSRWHAIGLPILLDTIVFLYTSDRPVFNTRGKVEQLCAMFKHTPDLVRHVRRFVFAVCSDELAQSIARLLVLCNKNIQEIMWTIEPGDLSQQRASRLSPSSRIVAIADRLIPGLRALAPRVAYLSEKTSFGEHTDTASVLGRWSRASLREIHVKCDADCIPAWIFTLDVPELHFTNLIEEDWEDLKIEEVVKKPNVRRVFLSGYYSMRIYSPLAHQMKLTKLLESSSEEVRAIVQLVDPL